jgi:threonine synthase
MAPETATGRITLGEGGTPLIALPRLAAGLGVRSLYGKMELVNPTGSYKDRIAARSMEVAIERGQRGWIATSSGNAGTSFAAYARRAGLPGVLCVTESITREKLLPALALGAHVVRIVGLGHGGTRATERGLFDAVREAAERHDLYLGVTAHRFNDAGMRAVDAIAAEILADGVTPDAVYVPTGGGGLVTAVARGFRQAGAATAVIAAQPAGCGPIARCLTGEIAEPVIDRNRSEISALQLPGPPDGEVAIEAVRATGGWGVVASDEEILESQRLLASAEGVFVEPAAGCALAGLRDDLENDRVGADAVVALVLSGSGLKDLATLEEALAPPALADLGELPGMIDDWAREARPD